MEGRFLNEEKEFTCAYCNKAFTYRSALKYHDCTHSGEKPYQCNLCDKTFAHISILEDHINIHTGVKSYKCNFHSCDRVFAAKQELYFHKSSHNGQKQPIECNLCHEAFRKKSALLIHMRNHTGEKPFNCNLCDKSFAAKCYLKRHTMIHGEDKPFKCNFCEKAFTHKKKLKWHTIIHTGETPYKFDLCQKAFAKSSTLKYHLKSHSREKICNSELCQRTELSIMERHLESTSDEKFSISHERGSCVDGNVSSITETKAELSLQQNTNQSPEMKLNFGNNWTIDSDVDAFVSGLCGCGICDQIFEIKKEFIEHCSHHFQTPQKDTFLDLCEHLSCYYC